MEQRVAAETENGTRVRIMVTHVDWVTEREYGVWGYRVNVRNPQRWAAIPRFYVIQR